MWASGFGAAVILIVTATAAVAANPEHLQQLKQTRSCPHCDLSHSDLRTSELKNADLNHANLSHANLSGMNLSNTTLSGANLTATNLTAANLKRANLKGAFSQTQCDDVLADLATFSAFAILKQSRPSDPAFACSIAEIVDLARITNTPLRTSSESRDPDWFQEFVDQIKSQGTSLKRVRTRFYNANLQDANLEDARLQGADFRSAGLDGVNLNNANLNNALFFNTSLDNVNRASFNSSYLDIAAVQRELQIGLDQVTKRFQTQATQLIEHDARMDIGHIIRNQQAYYLEHQRFTLELGELKVDRHRLSNHYKLKIFALKTPKSDTLPLGHNRAVWVVSLPHNPKWQSYIGIVWMGLDRPTVSFSQGMAGKLTLSSLVSVCQSNQSITQVPEPPSFRNKGLQQSDVICPKGYSLAK